MGCSSSIAQDTTRTGDVDETSGLIKHEVRDTKDEVPPAALNHSERHLESKECADSEGVEGKGETSKEETKTTKKPSLQGREMEEESTTVTADSSIPTYNGECKLLAQQLVTAHPALQSAFEDINAFVRALDSDPELKFNGDQIRELTQKVVGRSYVNKDENARRILAEYMSYVKAAESIYKAYSAYLKLNDLEFLTDSRATHGLSAEDYKFIRGIRTILWNYTDASLQFSERVCNCGMLRYLVGDLQAILHEAGDASKVAHDDKFFRAARGVLHNCSNNPITRQTIRELGTVQVALAYLKDGSPVIKMTILLLLANIIDEEDNKVLIADGTVFTVILRMIQYAWKKPRHRCDGFSVAELTVGLTGLAKNDENKRILTEKGALPVLLTILEGGSDEEREKAAQCVWELAFDKDNQKTFLDNTQLLAVLEELKTSSNRKLTKVAEGALWAINQENGEKEIKKSLQDTNGKALKGHVMISYQWADQKILIKVKEFLKSQNFNVWMDIDNMEGSTLQAMAEAVQNAAVVLVCMSERYKLSLNCRSEAEYAFDLKKPIIPLLMQRGYKPDGWLGLIKGAKLFFDFSGKYSFDAKLTDLAKELGNRGKCSPAEDALDGGPSAVVKAIPADVGRASGTVVDWSKKDVYNWLSKLGLDSKATLKSLTGKQLSFLRKVSYKAPEFFYVYLKTDLQLNNLEDLMNFSEAVESL